MTLISYYILIECSRKAFHSGFIFLIVITVHSLAGCERDGFCKYNKPRDFPGFIGFKMNFFPDLSSLCFLCCKNLLRELGNYLIEVAYHAIISNIEDRRILILIDGDDDIRLLHACYMLDGT